MARVKGSVATRASRKKILNAAEGYYGSKHLLFRTAKEQVLHSYQYAYISRRLRKRDFRKLWIRRINAACRMNDISYSRFMNGLKKSGVAMNRKMLSELAINDPKAFASLAEKAKKATASASK
jgi:large subunit ribosomal protein L20